MRHHERLEVMWAEANGLDPKGMVACSSGTAALHLAFEAKGDGGKNVMVPDFSMIACARAVTLSGRAPVLIDCLPDLNMDPSGVRQHIDEPANNAHGMLSAILAVHTYGRRPDIRRIFDKASDVGANLVEDLAEAHGVTPALSDAACWSFYRNKIVHGEEGGAVWFRDPACAVRARSLRCLGFTDAHDFDHIPRGHNYRLADSLAWLICQSIPHLEDNLKRRRDIESYYDRCCPTEWKMPPRDVVWVYDIRIPGMSRETQTRLVSTLRDSGIDARHGFWPISLQKEYRGCRLERTDIYREPLSHTMGREVIYLPAHPGITESQAERAFEVIKSCVGSLRTPPDGLIRP